MKELLISQNKKALLDDEDYEKFSVEKWFYSNGYARRADEVREQGKRITTARWLHREIMGATRGEIIDHINRNTLDNRKENLRYATHSLNQQNRKVNSNNKSGVRCVYWHKQKQKWHIQVMLNRKKQSLGLYKDLDEAKKVYDDWFKTNVHI